MKRTLPLLLALAALVAALFVFPHIGRRAVEVETHVQPPPADAGAPGDPRTPDDGLVIHREETDPREGAKNPYARGGEYPGWVVRVIDSRTRKAVQGARVRWVNETLVSNLADDVRKQWFERPWDPVFEEFAAHTTTDEKGFAQLPRLASPDSWYVIAEHETRCGSTLEYDPRGEVIEIALVPRWKGTIEVRDELNRRVGGIPLEVDVEMEETEFCVWSGETPLSGDPVAMDRLLESIWIFAHERYWEIPPEDVPIRFDTTGLFQGFPSMHGTLRSLQGRPVILRIPGAGRFRIRLEEPTGEPLSWPAIVRCEIRHGELEERKIADQFVELVVPIREEFRIDVMHRHGNSRGATWTGPGPKSPGETIDLTLRFEEDENDCHVVFRVLDELGNPLRDVSLEIALGSDDDSDEIRTDPQGRIRVDADGWRERGIRRLRIWQKDEWYEMTRRSAEVHFQDVPITGEVDGGTVVLSPEPLLVSGWVTDEHERSVPGLELFPDGKHVIPTISGVDGSFEIRGRATGQIFIETGEDNFLVQRHGPFDVGATDVHIAVRHGGVLLLTTRVHHRKALSWISAEASLQGSEEPWSLWSSTAGRFSARGLPSGVYRVELRSCGILLLTVDDVSVRCGEITKDPRLQNIDLDQLAPIRRVHLLDLEGRSLARSAFSIHLPGTESTSTGMGPYTDSEGRVALHLPIDTGSLWVYTYTYFPELVTLRSEDETEIRFRPEIRVQFSFVSKRDAEFPRSLEGKIFFHGDDSELPELTRSWDLPTLRPGWDGEDTLFLPLPGPYEIVWNDEGYRPTRFELTIETDRIEIPWPLERR